MSTAQADASKILEGHSWRFANQSCKCGWTQHRSLPLGMAQLNHSYHLAEILAMAGVLRTDIPLQALTDVAMYALTYSDGPVLESARKAFKWLDPANHE